MTSHRLQGRHILIVDDDEDILSSFDLAMRTEGAETTMVSDGHAAVSACLTDPPDAVVLDMMLPRQSGFLVLERILQSSEPPAVIMVTANLGKRHMAYAHNLGVHAYLTKPVPLQRLVDTVVQLIQGSEDEAPSGEIVE